MHKIVLTSIAVTILLAACGPVHNFTAMRRGMDEATTNQHLVSPPILSHQGTSRSTRPYRIDLYRRSNLGEPAQDYYLVYKRGVLDFWGYGYELARADEPVINTLLDEMDALRRGAAITSTHTFINSKAEP